MDRRGIKTIVKSAIILLIISVGFVSCEKYVYDPPTVDPEVDVLFATEIVPLFTANCLGCHGCAISPDLRAANAYESLTDGGYVNTTTPETSRIYTKITSNHATSTNISELDRLKLLTWITQGAKNN